MPDDILTAEAPATVSRLAPGQMVVSVIKADGTRVDRTLIDGDAGDRLLPAISGKTEMSKVRPSQMAVATKQQRVLHAAGIDKAIGEILVSMGFLPPLQAEAGSGLSRRKQDAADLISLRLQQTLGMKVMGIEDGAILVALTKAPDPFKEDLLIQEARRAGIEADRVEILPIDRMSAIALLGQARVVHRDVIEKRIQRLTRDPGEGSLLQLIIQEIFSYAVQIDASDISVTVEPRYLEQSNVAFRVDGTMQYEFFLHPDVAKPLSTRLKAMANIDFSDRSRPHDNRITMQVAGRDIDVRVGVVPTDPGELITMRLLDPRKVLHVPDLFGSMPETIRYIRGFNSQPTKSGGVLLISGPTGSGKTTTQNAVLLDVDRTKKKVVTIENPIEYKIPMTHQIQVQTDEQWGEAMRAVLRHDPDVIALGEMRDRRTAEACNSMAESGHKVTVTVHADDAPQTISRVADFFDERNRKHQLGTLGAHLYGVVNQRLLSAVCPHCSSEVEVGDEVAHTAREIQIAIERLKIPSRMLVRRPNLDGCGHCHHTGHFRRVLSVEQIFIPRDHSVRRQVVERLTSGLVHEIVDIEGVYFRSHFDRVVELLHQGYLDLSVAIGVIEATGYGYRGNNDAAIDIGQIVA